MTTEQTSRPTRYIIIHRSPSLSDYPAISLERSAFHLAVAEFAWRYLRVYIFRSLRHGLNNKYAWNWAGRNVFVERNHITFFPPGSRSMNSALGFIARRVESPRVCLCARARQIRKNSSANGRAKTHGGFNGFCWKSPRKSTVRRE